MTTPWQKHVAEWRDCQRCELCKTRKKVVLARGVMPCDLVFIGEAPGESEDCLGKPFVGPAGHMLNQIIADAFARVKEPPTYALTNLIACIPRDPEQGGKADEPLPEHVKACAPRLQEFVLLCNPKLLVTVGTQARNWTDPKVRNSVKFHRTIPSIHLVHPSAILKANIAQRGFLTQRNIVTLANAVLDME